MSKKYKIYIGIMAGAVVLLNITAWLSKGFCDWYIRYIFRLWPNTLGRISNLFPFSVGEIMIILGILLVVTAVVLGVLCIFLRRRPKFMSVVKGFYKVFIVIFLNVCMVMTLNCTLLYHCTPIDPNKNAEKREYSIDELEDLYIYVVEQSNYYAERMERDGKGNIVYNEDMKEHAAAAMRNISDEYERLNGYYPRVKDIRFSSLMCQAYMCGYYFPFSMEANVNYKMYIANMPPTYCHELSHLHGYIYEDEANFLGYLACIRSGDAFFAYAGYLSVLSYIQGAYMDSIEDLSDEEWVYRVSSLPEISDKVLYDDVFLLEETWEEVEDTAIIDTEKVEEISDAFTETSLQLNGVSEGMAAYQGVVGLLLEYYDGVLY